VRRLPTGSAQFPEMMVNYLLNEFENRVSTVRTNRSLARGTGTSCVLMVDSGFPSSPRSYKTQQSFFLFLFIEGTGKNEFLDNMPRPA
jgi:hypothetical protein